MFQYNISYILRPNDVDEFKVFFAQHIREVVFDKHVEMNFWKLINEQGNDTVTISQQIKIKSLAEFMNFRAQLESQLRTVLEKFPHDAMFFTSLMKAW